MRYLSALGLKPETPLEIVEKAPFGGPITVRIKGKDHAISHKIAALIEVRKIDG